MSVMPVLFKKFLLEALSIAVSAGVALSPPPAGLETEAMWVAGLLVWTLLNLILRFIPDFVVLMMMSCMWVVLHIMPFQQAFESFTGTTVWLLVGALGIAIVASTSWCTLRVGASVFLAISTAGQIISSQLIDQFGLFGMPVQKFNAKQIPGYVLLAAGVALVVTG